MRRPEPGRHRRQRPSVRGPGLAVCAAAALLTPAEVCAQSLEPRAYSPAPVGVNFAVAAVSQNTGGLSTGDNTPLTDAKLTLTGPILGFARTLDLWGRSGKIDVILPTGWLSGSALYQGAPVSREVSGLADPLVRVSALFVGAPAMDPTTFRSYRQDLIVGASLQVSIPLGQYDDTRLLNLSAHRWWVKPELGVSKAWGAWTVEAAAAATVYGENDDFFGGHRRSQDPIYSARTSAIYSFRSGVWASLDATFFTGGRTSLDGAAEANLQRNWRVGATLAVPVTRRTSLKLSASRGVSARTGNNYDQLALAWQYRWGGGV
jgi:hypothetical protein